MKKDEENGDHNAGEPTINENMENIDKPAKQSQQQQQESKDNDSEETIRNYISELSARFADKRAKRYKNDVANIQYPDDDFFVRLDTSIKKNSAFVKKIRNMSESNKDQLIKDLENLNLSRFITELTTALIETKIKTTDINVFVQICQLLHHRYQDFHQHLFDAWNKNLPQKSVDAQFNLSKMRVDIKIFAELILTGIFPTKDALPALGNLLTKLTQSDKETHRNLNVLIAFCRGYAIEFAGIYPRQQKLLAEKYQLQLPVCDFLSADRQRGVRQLLKDYYQSLIQHIRADRKYLYNLKNDIKRNLEQRGEISEKLQEKWKLKASEFEKLYQSTLIFADLIDEKLSDDDIINLEQLEQNDDMLELMKNNDNITTVLFDANRFKDNNQSIWDDEETRIFYENLPDLKSLVPVMLYKDSLKDDATNVNDSERSSPIDNQQIDQQQQQQSLKNDEQNDENVDQMKSVDDLLPLTSDDTSIPDPKDVPLLNENDDIDPAEQSSSAQSTPSSILKDNDKNAKRSIKFNFNATKDQLETFFSSLPNCVNCDLIDKAALHFATTFNTKNNRKKLIDVLIRVPRTRLDLLPFYSRFVAQLAPIMPNVARDLCVGLKNQFRYNFYKKDQVYIESKVKIVRFIGELVKFNIFPKTDALKILKTLLSDFHHHHIEMTCNLFEVCGRYLYRLSESHHMTNLLIQQMMRLKNRMYVNTRYETMIQNAYYSVIDKDEKAAIKKIQAKPIINQYIEHLIYTELTRKTVSNVMKKLRRLDWTNDDICTFVVKTLSSVWNVKCDNIPALANLLSNLSQIRPQIVLMVMDQIMEDIRLGMQMNSVEYNQRRISTIKYFAECFNYNLLDSTLLFNVLYSFLLYGVDYNDIANSTLDSPFNLIRIRLVAQILHICGHFFLTPVAKKRLDFFLYFFQRYYWLKKSYLQSLPPEQLEDPMALFYLDAIYADVLQYLRPKFKKAQSYQQSCEQLEQRLNELSDNIKTVLPNVNASIKDIILSNKNKQQQPSIMPNDGQLEPIKEDSENEIDNESEVINESKPPINNDQNEDIEENGNDIDIDDNDGGGNENDDFVDESEENEIDDDDNSNDDEEDNSNDYTDEDSNEEDMDEDHDVDDDDEEDDGENGGKNSEKNKSNSLRIQQCEEDDLFKREFDRLMQENLQSRSQEVNQRINVEIVIPIERDNANNADKIDKTTSLFSLEPSSTSASSSSMMDYRQQQQQQMNQNEIYNFRVMTKNQKSNKPTLKTIAVPSDSELVQNFLAREQAQRKEKEKVKKLILGINERREMEDNSSSNSNNSNQSNLLTAAAAAAAAASTTTTSNIINSDNNYYNNRIQQHHHHHHHNNNYRRQRF